MNAVKIRVPSVAQSLPIKAVSWILSQIHLAVNGE